MSRSSVKLDTIDLKILRELQADASLPLTDLADRVGVSQTPCWRRVQKLEAAGIIRKRVTLLDRAQLNVGVTVFIAVRTNKHSVEWLETFARAVQDIPEIVDFYRMSGEIDYLLKAHVPDIGSYDALYKKLISKVELTDVTSMFAMQELKSTTEIPLQFANAGPLGAAGA
ncbi:Lrp/AsnC family transcriptional regulator [Aquabacter sp. CN5-332]|uniref:Lrp/AsnC family transcriptional regulator n=1 Tax=Aquabacter sp. CN5-332 TaxID=3156608 RepID=UPI0032B44F8F